MLANWLRLIGVYKCILTLYENEVRGGKEGEKYLSPKRSYFNMEISGSHFMNNNK